MVTFQKSKGGGVNRTSCMTLDARTGLVTLLKIPIYACVMNSYHLRIIYRLSQVLEKTYPIFPEIFFQLLISLRLGTFPLFYLQPEIGSTQNLQ